MNKVRTISQARNALKPVFDLYGVKKAIVFGSVAKGTASDNSDLDILVDSGLRGLQFMGLAEAVREAAGVPVDIFDVRHIEKYSKIDREISDSGVMIYEK